MILDKNKIQVIFSFEFKMGHKAVETTHNINKAFGPGTANECTVQWWFKKFCKGDESPDDKEHSGSPLEVGDDLLRAIIKAESLKITQEVAQELNVNHSMVIQHLKQIGKVQKLDKWVPQELTTNQKSCHFEVSSSLIVHNNEPFFYQTVMYNEKVDFIWHQVMTSSMAGLRRSSKALPKAKPAPKKVMVTVWWSAAGLTHYSFLSLSKTIISEKYAQQIDEMHQKLQYL